MPIPPYRVRTTTQTVGTGALQLDATTGLFRSFASHYGTAPRQIRYLIQSTAGFEIGIGTFDGGNPGTLTRGTVLASSNGGALYTLPTGSKEVAGLADLDRATLNPSSSLSLAAADLNSVVAWTGTAASTVTLPAVAGAPPGAGVLVCNAGTALLTLAASGSDQITGFGGSVALPPGETCEAIRVGSSWVAVGLPKGWRQIERRAVGANVGSVDIVLPGGFDMFRLVWNYVGLASDGKLFARTSNTGGSSFASGSGDYGTALVSNAGTSGADGAYALSSGVALSGDAAAGALVSGSVDVEPGSSAVTARFVNGTFLSLKTDASAFQVGSTAGQRAANGVVNAVRLFNSGGNMNGGLVVVEGRRV